mmetsp:Transcript_126735/g.253341  ORF Transcript_126735/g.253341 Transcript_126735/m.253341 type:complete len:464 (+) Transcript_126735:41-1432(+)
MLALEWYRHQPLPDATPANQKAPNLTDLSRRLLAAFEAGLHCDVAFHFVTDGASAPPLEAHRVVLQRNTALSKSFGADLGAEMCRLDAPAGLSSNTLRLLFRLHYLEAEADVVTTDVQNSNNSAALHALQELREKVTVEEWHLLESSCGLLDVASWQSLRGCVAAGRHTDCTLQLDGGVNQPAHLAVIGGVDDGHYFEASSRWPGNDKKLPLPAGCSHEAFQSMLRARYGANTVDMETILEARHFAELVDWRDVARCCEVQLQAALANQALDGDSLLAALSHAEGNDSYPAHLRAAALAAAVRQWSKVTETAASALSPGRCHELAALHRIRNRDGHVCGSLEEYLLAAADDLTEWEDRLSFDAPLSTRRDLERAWKHWHSILFEYGHLNGAAAAEQWRARVSARRESRREDRANRRTAQLPEGKVWFEAAQEWREVLPTAICPAGLEYRFDMVTGKNYARLIV